MKQITLKGLILRMMLAFVAIAMVLYVYPSYAGEMQPYAQVDALAQAHVAQLPAAPTLEEHRQAQERVLQLRALHPVEPDAIGSIRPMVPYRSRLQAPAFGEWNEQGKE